MASITVRNLEEDVKERLRARAAENGRSMEEEVRQILLRALPPELDRDNLFDCIRTIVAPIGGIELHIATREPMRGSPLPFDDA